ncbi:MAG: SGNH/GDSL hydrolase family protein [Acetatifactor sp.]|nr:SGNH/GDSL hydrolase family protein [Acetatifactor sp.]
MEVKRFRKSIAKLLALSLTVVAAVGECGMTAKAAGRESVVIVSMGDSYSSGEGLSNFYGYDEYKNTGVYNEDWLSHRSKISWPSRLEVPGIDGTMSNYHVPFGGTATTTSKWYFVAVSGAETIHFDHEQPKPAKNPVKMMTPQLNVFNQITDPVDYVTLTIGGNDVKFADVITNAVKYSYTIGGYKKFEKYLEGIWATRFDTLANIKATYKKIEQAAGTQATILVAGYPTLVKSSGCLVIHEKHAQLINEKVLAFNDLLADLVVECQGEGMNIKFVDVAASFKGHEAYTSDNWINKISTRHDDDIPKDGLLDVVSAYSMHPNDKGVAEYARLVNLAIKDSEEKKAVEGNYRIVLKWGEDPSDLDSHLEGKLSNGDSFSVDFHNKNAFDEGQAICHLSADDMMRHGPEEIVLDVKSETPYYYYVYRYRGAGKLQSSSATVEVYKDDALIKTFTVPAGDDAGNYWNVFAIVNGNIVEKNTITKEADVKYADK